MKLKMSKSQLISLVFFISVFVFLDFVTGPMITPDSYSFINGLSVRDALYPLFLKAFSILFKDNYLWYVSLVQSLLAGLSTWLLWEMCMELVGRCRDITKCIWGGCFAVLISSAWIIPSIIHGVLIPVSIWSEGITFSFYFIFIFALFKYINKRQFKYYLLSWFMVLLCTLNRKGMITFLFALIIIFLIMEKKGLKKYVVVILSMLTLFFFMKISTVVYERIYYNEPELSAYDKSFFTDIIYFATEKDYGSMNEDERVLFDMSYTGCEELGYLYTYQHDKYKGMSQELAKASMYDESFMYASYFDEFCEYLEEKYGYDKKQSVENVKLIMKSIKYKIITNHKSEIIYIYFWRTGHAMLNTVFFIPKPFKDYKILLYVLEFILFSCYIAYVYLMIKNKKNNTNLFRLSVAVLLVVMENALGVALITFPVCRYVIYNCGLFYSLLLLNLRELKNNKDKCIDERSSLDT